MNNTGPTMYPTLMERHFSQPNEIAKEKADHLVGGLTNRFAELLENAMREAYVAGVQDGFREGVAVENAAWADRWSGRAGE